MTANLGKVSETPVDLLTSQAVTAWVKDLGRRKAIGSLRPATVANYTRDSELFAATLGTMYGDLPLRSVDTRIVDDVLAAYQSTPDGRFSPEHRFTPAGDELKKVVTVKRLFATLSVFFNEAARRGWVSYSPMPDSMWRRAKQADGATGSDAGAVEGLSARRRALKPVQVANLLDADLSARDMFILRVLAEAGPRVGELCAANRNDLTFDADANCYWLQLYRTKNSKHRAIPLTRRTGDWYDSYARFEMAAAKARPGRPETLADSERALLRSVYGRRITPRDVQNILKRVRTLTAVDVTPHGLRHTAATLLLESGEDVHNVRDLLGHSSIAVTSIYLDTQTRNLAAAVNASPVAAMGGGAPSGRVGSARRG